MRNYMFAISLIITFGSCEVMNPSGATNEIVYQGGVGLGSLLAVVISWDRNHSILWAILHAICGWFYVLYFVIVRNKKS